MVLERLSSHCTRRPRRILERPSEGGRNQDFCHADLAAGSNEPHFSYRWWSRRTLSLAPGSQKWTRIHASRISDRILRIGCVTVDPPQPAQVDRHLWISMPDQIKRLGCSGMHSCFYSIDLHSIFSKPDSGEATPAKPFVSCNGPA